MLFYVIRVFHICICTAQSHRKVLLFRSSDLVWIPLSTCVYARWGGAGGSEELRRATDIWVGPTFVALGNTPILPQLNLYQTRGKYCQARTIDIGPALCYDWESELQMWSWGFNSSGFGSRSKLLSCYRYDLFLLHSDLTFHSKFLHCIVTKLILKTLRQCFKFCKKPGGLENGFTSKFRDRLIPKYSILYCYCLKS